MDPFEMAVFLLIAALLVVLAVYFAWRQRAIMRTVHGDVNLSREHRRFWLKQTVRRLVGSVFMTVLAVLLVGSLFLDYHPEATRRAALVPILYWTMILLMVMVILILAILDLWATARFGIQEPKKLLQEHQSALEAELARLRQRQSELN